MVVYVCDFGRIESSMMERFGDDRDRFIWQMILLKYLRNHHYSKLIYILDIQTRSYIIIGFYR